MEVFGLGYVTGKLPQYFTKPDIWHLGLNLNVSRSFSAVVSFNPRVVYALWLKKVALKRCL